MYVCIDSPACRPNHTLYNAKTNGTSRKPASERADGVRETPGRRPKDVREGSGSRPGGVREVPEKVPEKRRGRARLNVFGLRRPAARAAQK